MKKEVEETTLHRMAKVQDCLDMWQHSQNLRAAEKESRAHNVQMTGKGYISDTEEIVKESWSLFQHDGAAAFKLSEISPLPPPLSAKDLPGGRTQILNVHRIRRINSHPLESHKDSAPESILDSEDWLNWNGDLHNPNDSENNCSAEVESDMDQDNVIEDPESPEQQDVSTPLNVPGLIRPIPKSIRHVEKVLVKVNAMETRRNMGVKKK
jgi:hypothetical protein